jgi:hypothetical protein
MKNSIKCLLLFSLWSCDETFPYETGRFPDEQPINLVDLNSVHDEMNSNFVPTTAETSVNFIFSSNAKSQGIHFDLDSRVLVFTWDKETGSFSFNVGNFENNQSITSPLFKINSQKNEKGPHSFFDLSKDGFILFSRDNSLEVYAIYSEPINAENQTIDGRNSTFRLFGGSANEMYPCFYGSDYLQGAGVQGNGRLEKMLFSSDRDGSFDIYEIDLPENQSVIDFMKSEQAKQIIKIGINTSSNDHMPFVYGDLLVFSSDRPGGYGGYDLYYSQRTSNGWSEPINFGPKINSEFDEFRPVVSDSWEFSNQVMIFSSNRPGGLGGFDLYFVGIEKF